MRMLKKLGGFIFLAIVSLLLIVIGLVLTVSIIFIYVGLPLLVIGVLLFILNILSLIRSSIWGLGSLFKPRKKKIRHSGKIIDVSENNGVTIVTGRPPTSSYNVRSTAQPRLWREPWAGSATKIRRSSGVAS